MVANVFPTLGLNNLVTDNPSKMNIVMTERMMRIGRFILLLLDGCKIISPYRRILFQKVPPPPRASRDGGGLSRRMSVTTPRQFSRRVSPASLPLEYAAVL